MGLYNTLTLDSSLELPNLDVKIDSWQTKDLIDDLEILSDVHLNADGQLEIVVGEHEWVDDADSFFGRVLKTTNTTFEPLIYTGYITFYNSYTHPEYALDSEHDFVRGWYEYRAHFVDGLLTGGVDRIGYTEAKKLTLEETAVARQTAEDNRTKIQNEQRERRKNKPSPVERLIDTIDGLADKRNNFTMPEMSDYAETLRCISEEIQTYREKYDLWYTK
jgi:hypothetical protein